MNKIIKYTLEEYSKLEQDLCELHHETDIEKEYEVITNLFRKLFNEFEEDTDFEIPEWHNEIRMLWVYLYHDSFYKKEFIKKIQAMLAQQPKSWFAQFECFSPKLESEQLPTGMIGTYIIYKDSIIFDQSEEWSEFMNEIKKKV